MEKKSKMSKRFKRGSYSSILTLIVVLAVVVANLLIRELPAKYTEIDVTGKNLFAISKQTKEVADNLSEDVTIYLIAQTGKQNSILAELLERYGELSKHIKVKQVDPVDNPSFTGKYSKSMMTENSLIVESEKRYKIVGYAEIFQNSYAGMDSNGEAVTTTEFAGEEKITSAIGYVVTDNLPTLYTLSGHGETEISETLKQNITRENIAINSLNLMTQKEIPEDCDGIFVVSPQRDFTDAETGTLEKYMAQGGKMFLIIDYIDTELPNVKKLMDSYGLATKDGIVLEGDAEHYIQQSYFMVPDFVEHSITKPMMENKIKCLAVTAQALVETENKDNAKISWLMKTSDKAFNKAEIVDESSLIQKEEDETGSFYLGAFSEKGTGETASAMAVLTTSAFVSDEVNEYIAGGNYDLLINTIGMLCEHEDAITIHTKNLDTEYIALNANQVLMWTIVLVVAIPLVLLIAGVVIWIVRRRR